MTTSSISKNWKIENRVVQMEEKKLQYHHRIALKKNFLIASSSDKTKDILRDVTHWKTFLEKQRVFTLLIMFSGFSVLIKECFLIYQKSWEFTFCCDESDLLNRDPSDLASKNPRKENIQKRKQKVNKKQNLSI